jgi:hypothetical protein
VGLPSAAVLRRSLDQYDAVVARHGVARLAELDRWYRAELPGLITARKPQHLTRDELVRATEWKMARGVWRQGNLVLVKGNPVATVKETSARALSQLPDPRTPIAELATLKGVGPATASAIAAAVAPERYPFFDELVAAQLPELGEVKWTLPYYLRYAEALRAHAAKLGGDWTPSSLERALWAHVGGKAGRG